MGEERRLAGGGAPRDGIEAPSPRWGIFTVVWALGALGLGAALVFHPRPQTVLPVPSVVASLALTATLFYWKPFPRLTEDGAATSRSWLAALIVAAVAILIGLVVIAGTTFLLIMTAVAGVLLLALRPAPPARLWAWTAVLACVAAVSGLAGPGQRWGPVSVRFDAVVVGFAVALTLPAGWVILEYTGLRTARVGPVLGEWSIARAGLAFATGAVIGLPWALANIGLGAGRSDGWVRHWWQPLAALQPGIAEEVWARLFLVALVYWLLQRAAARRTALLAAMLVAGYWFAWLHNPALTLPALGGTLLLGTAFSLPMTLLWLTSGLEAAVGFHVVIDLIRWVAAYALFR